MRSTLILRKAGEALVKSATKELQKNAPAAGAAATKVGGEAMEVVEPRMLETPRAVSPEDIMNVIPPRESTTVTMMPWRGWIQRWIGNTFGPKRLQQFRETFLFMPDDDYDLSQVPFPANKEVQISKTDPSIKAAYRYPSPGSQPAVRIPRLEDGEDPYDSGHFKRDTRRRYQFSELSFQDPKVSELQLELMKGPSDKEDDPEINEQIGKVSAGPDSSPGNKGRFATGPTDFDPTGLRASMSVTWEEANKELDKHMPDHLPTPTHMKKIGWEKWYEERDLPIPMGDYYEDLKVPTHKRIARW